LSRLDLGKLFFAVGGPGGHFVSMVVHAIAQEHDLDVQAERDGANYILVCTETAGDLIVAEHRLQIVFDDLPEVVKLFVLRVYLQGVLGVALGGVDARDDALPLLGSGASANDGRPTRQATSRRPSRLLRVSFLLSPCR